MIKKLLITIILSIAVNYSYAQNLVSNPSFEDTLGCPSNYGEINKAQYWSSPTSSTPDYFNSCNHSIFGVPSNGGGYQLAKTGNAYIGIIALQPSYIEYVQGELSDTLKKNSIYCVSFYVNLIKNSNAAIAKMGAYLSDSAVFIATTNNFTFQPQIESPVGYYLSDTLNWMEVSGFFKAKGGEKYITIGNFHDINNSDTIHLGNSSSAFAYYFIDDISIINCDSLAGINELTEKNSSFKIYPNPTAGSLTLTLSKGEGMQEIKIYNVLGECVLYQQRITNSQQLTLDVSTLQNGIYIVEIQTEKEMFRKKFVKSF